MPFLAMETIEFRLLKSKILKRYPTEFLLIIATAGISDRNFINNKVKGKNSIMK